MKIQQAALAIAVLSTVLFGPPAANAGDEIEQQVTTVLTPSHGRPVVAKADAKGTIHLLFDSNEGPKYAQSTDGGRTFEAAIPVAVTTKKQPGLEYSAWDMALGQGGRVHVALGTNAWKLKLPQDEWGFYYANLDPGSAAFTPVRNINHKPSEGFSLAADLKGRLTACWLSDKLYANVSRDNGATFDPGIELDAHYNPCNCCTTSAAYGEDGRLAVLYREETDDNRDMFLVLWDQVRGEVTRNRVGRTSWHVNACPMTYFTVAGVRGGYSAVWPTRGEIYFARLDGSGHAPQSPEIKTPGRSGMRTGMLALCAPNGNTLVAWKHEDKIGWQCYSAAGQARGVPGAVKSSGNGVAGIVDKDGRFVLFR
jgi:hypothetical protein